MSGIEILTSESVATATIFNMEAFWITVCAVCLICLCIGVLMSIDESSCAPVIFMTIVGIILGVMTGAVGGEALATPTDYETHYKVTISNEVSMAEFCEHYEVIEQDGKMFTIREKTND